MRRIAMGWFLLLLLAGRTQASPPTPPPNSVQALLIQLGDSEPILRHQAARELGRRGVAGRGAVPALGRLVSDPDPAVGNQAARALVQIGPVGGRVGPSCLVRLVAEATEEGLSDCSPRLQGSFVRSRPERGQPCA